jgi:hypothetical protein
MILKFPKTWNTVIKYSEKEEGPPVSGQRAGWFGFQ